MQTHPNILCADKQISLKSQPVFASPLTYSWSVLQTEVHYQTYSTIRVMPAKDVPVQRNNLRGIEIQISCLQTNPAATEVFVRDNQNWKLGETPPSDISPIRNMQ